MGNPLTTSAKKFDATMKPTILSERDFCFGPTLLRNFGVDFNQVRSTGSKDPEELAERIIVSARPA